MAKRLKLNARQLLGSPGSSVNAKVTDFVAKTDPSSWLQMVRNFRRQPC